MSTTIVSRQDALKQGLGRYRTGKPCKRGHKDWRLTSNGECCACHRDKVNEKIKSDRLAKRTENLEQYRAIFGDKIVTRDEAIKRGLPRYFTGQPCKLGHISERHTASATCIECKNQKFAASYHEAPQKYREISNLWAKLNPEKTRIYSSNRRSRQASAEGSFCFDDVMSLYNRQKGKCSWCKTKVKFGDHHVDHIVPLAKGGSNSPSNLCISCPTCNFRKKDKLPENWARELGMLL